MPSLRLRVVIAVGVWVMVSPVVGFAESGTGGNANGSGVSDAAVPPVSASSTSHQGLIEQAAPDGGVMVDLRGRFRSAATATVGADGKVHVDSVPPGTAAQKE